MNVLQVIKKHSKGRTVLMSTHYMDEAEYLGDRIVIMMTGKIKVCGSPLYLKKRYGACIKCINLLNVLLRISV